MKKRIILIVGIAIVADAVGFTVGRAYQFRIDAQQAILFDSLALSALDAGNTNHATYHLKGILSGNVVNVDQVRRNPFWPSYSTHQWKDGPRWYKQLEWSRERIKRRTKVEETAQPPYSEPAARSPQR